MQAMPSDVRTFPATYSVLSADALLDELRVGYSPHDLGGSAPASCVPWHLGTNDTYAAETEDGRGLMLRVAPTGWRTPSDLAWELALVQHLARKGIAVAEPVPRADGALFFTLPAPEGPRLAALFGRVPGREVGPAPEECRLLGEVSARLHLASAGFQAPAPRFALDLSHLLEEPLAHVGPFLARRPEDLDYVEEVAKEVRARVLALAEGLAWGSCHGDLQGANAFLGEDGTVCLFDFDCGGKGWWAYDLAVFRWIVERFRWPKGCWDAFLAGYDSHRPLTQAEREAIPWLVQAREIWLAGMHLAPAASARWGHARYGDRSLDRFVGALRRWRGERLGLD